MESLIFTISLFQVKHFLADFPFQTKWMAENKGKNFKALFSHVIVHISFTVVLLYIFQLPFLRILQVLLFEFFFHAGVDYFKASENFLGRYKLPNKFFWIFLGFDQLLHQLSYLLIVWAIMKWRI